MSDVDTRPVDTSGVSVERDGDILVISLARPDAMNAVNDAIRYGLVDACHQAADDPLIRAVLIRAEGDRAFCVGADIKESRVAPTDAETRSPPADRDYTTAIAAMSKPVICAIHGFCLGAGLEIALACDIRIATPQASFGLPEVNLGLIPGAGGTQRLTRLIGMARALDMMLTGERMKADRACEVGLITRIAADRAALDTESRALAHALAAKPPLALTYLKDVVRTGMDISLTAGLARERELFAILKTTEDAREAAEAFKEKRPGHFAGR